MTSPTQGEHAQPAISGALFDFLGFLTTLPKSKAVTFSGSDDAAPAVAVLREWARSRGLSLDNADVGGWTATLTASPVAQDVLSKRARAALVLCDEWLRDIQKRPGMKLALQGLRDEVNAVLAPQPAVAAPLTPEPGAVPLTDEQIEAIAKPFISRVGSHWENDDAIPDNGRIEEFARAIEAAHGIKGDHDGNV